MEKIQTITACVFLYKDGKLFTARRADNKKLFPGKFELIGGHIEFGETVEDGLKREIAEEIHAEIVVENPYHVFTYLAKDGLEHSVEIDYFARLADEKQEIKLNTEDHSEYAWISEEEIDKYFEDGDDEKVAVQKGFQMLCLTK
jgi:8-oxo-dGTP diphosphatase